MAAEGTTTGARSRSRARPRHAARSSIDYGPLESSIGYRLRRAQLAIFDDVIRIFDDVGLRPGSFSVLLIVGRNPGLKQSEVCGALGIQRTNFVGLIDTLESRGLVVRKAAANDRRSNALHLTDAGRKLISRASGLQRQHEATLAKRLGPGGREKLLNLLEQLAH